MMPPIGQPAFRHLVGHRRVGGRGHGVTAGRFGAHVDDLGRLEDAVGRVAVGRHHQHRVGLDQHRLAGVRIENVGEQLLGGVDVGPVDQLFAEHVDPRSVVGGAVVGVVGRALPLVVVGRAEHQVQQPFLLVQAEDFAHLGRPLQDQVGAVEEDRLPGHRHDEAVLGGRGGLDVVLAQADAGIGHARPHLGRLVARCGRCRESSRRRTGWEWCSTSFETTNASCV